ncbi:MAG TPA: SagB family peptide dehydrogenase [Acidimicrobiales bacterium]|nr:SagB family peptide dehydrogenase [Acidimicrobiales bacterium]
MVTLGSAGLEECVRLRDDASAELNDGGRLLLSRGSKRFAVGPLVSELTPALDTLVAGGASTHALRALVTPGPSGAADQLDSLLERLDARGWLERALHHDGVPLVTVKPMVAKVAPAPAAASPPEADGDDDGTVVLSRFALLHRAGSELVLESPRSSAVVVVHDPRVAAFVASLATPHDVGDLDPVAFGLPLDVLHAVATVLVDAAMLVRHDDEEQATMGLAQWSLPDLLFHTRSRQGRHANGYGATWPLKGRFPPLPMVKPPAEDGVALPRPDLAAVVAGDSSFTEVLERRQSVRMHDDASPVTVEQLGEFLYRCAAVRHDVTAFSDGTPRPVGMARPYPTGGALYELELYAVVNRCAGLSQGLYHYDPMEHALGVLTAGLTPALESLLQQTCAKTGNWDRPQVLLTLTARFGKVMYKYEAIPYATILKNVGVLYQTMYLVATSMGLAPCALGGGDSDAFATVAGLDYYEETSVGEFLLGSRHDVPAARVDDAQRDLHAGKVDT